ncbi:MAG: hypothetical protein V8R80_08815 [Eubacterium sp.]
MEEKSWLSFEKSGLVEDYLQYCKSSIGKYADYETDGAGRSVGQDGADMYSDWNDFKYDACGRVR